MSTPTIPPQMSIGTPQVDAACAKFVQRRQRPLLVLFYPAKSRLGEWDLEDVYHTIRLSGATPEKKLKGLDVLIDSNGGNPVAGYRLAQLIRDFSEEAAFVVPDHAYSAATLLCFAGEEIRLAHFAGLSPIDITLVSENGRAPRREVELATVDSYMEFAKTARKTIEEQLAKIGCVGTTKVDSDLLVAMVKEVGAIQVGKYYRERLVTGYYAEALLDSYMFRDYPDKIQRRDDVIRNFLLQAPAHNFHLDFHLCKDWGLEVEEMPTAESDLSKAVLAELVLAAEMGAICPIISNRHRLPYFGWYSPTQQAASPPAQPEQAQPEQAQPAGQET